MYICFLISIIFYIYIYIYKDIGTRGVTMEGSNLSPHKKSKKQIQQVLK
jgi:hypothetical protein